MAERTRTCVEPQYNGKPCFGPKDMQKSCNKNQCPRKTQKILWKVVILCIALQRMETGDCGVSGLAVMPLVGEAHAQEKGSVTHQLQTREANFA